MKKLLFIAAIACMAMGCCKNCNKCNEGECCDSAAVECCDSVKACCQGDSACCGHCCHHDSVEVAPCCEEHVAE